MLNLIKGLTNRLQNLVTIAQAVMIQEEKVQAKTVNNAVQDNIEHFQAFGFRSMPPKDSKGIKLNVLANGTNSVIICVDNINYHFTALADGEAIMEVQEGCKVHLKQDKTIDIVAATVNITGDLKVSGNVYDLSNTSLADLRNTYNTHTNPSGGVVAEKVGA